MPVTKTCAQCGQPFECPPSQEVRRTVCSRECYREYRKGKTFINLTRKCEHCGKEYETHGAKSQYCSVECRESAYRLPLTKNCEHCGKPFHYKHSQAARARYCSLSCRGAAKTDRASVTKICEICGTPFSALPSRKSRLGKTYCSRICANKGIAKSKDKGGHLNKSGYRIIRRDGDYILEHRYIMQQYLGRALYVNENVHHKNGQRADNRLENLELWVKPQVPGQRLEDVIEWMTSFLSLYGYAVTKHSQTPSPVDQLDQAGAL